MGLNQSLTAAFFILISCSPKEKSVYSEVLTSNTTALLQAISIVDESTAWIGGHEATFCRTTNGGNSWEVFKHESDTLQFRDIHAFDKDNIVLMSAGAGTQSRIYLFDYSSNLYQESYIMQDSAGFLNTIEFWDNQNGLAFGDSFNGNYFILKTTDGGQSWERVNPQNLPIPGKGEGGFAASGTCISMLPNGKAFIGTGAGGNSNILFTENYGLTWTIQPSPLVAGEFAGIFSIRISGDFGLVVGGDFNQQDNYTNNTAVTFDQGKSWKLTNHPVTKGMFYGSDVISYDDRYFVIACGPNGIDYSWNNGEHWFNLDSNNYWAVDIDQSGVGYAAGTKGEILKISIK